MWFKETAKIFKLFSDLNYINAGSMPSVVLFW